MKKMILFFAALFINNIAAMTDTMLIDVVRNGDIVALRQFLDQGGNVNKIVHPYYGRTLLHVAVKANKKKVVALLLSRGAAVNQCNEEGRTSLFIAAEHGCRKMVNMLLGSGADMNKRDTNDQTPLHRAAVWGHEKVVELLLSKGALLDPQDNFGRTPLLLAAEAQKRDVVDVLLKWGADPTKADNLGRTPLQFIQSRKVVESNVEKQKLDSTEEVQK